MSEDGKRRLIRSYAKVGPKLRFGKPTQADLARRFGVSRSYVQKILQEAGVVWKR